MFIIIRFLGNLLGLWVASSIVSGFGVVGGLKGYVIAALVLMVLNLIVKPILSIITLPLIILTLGIFYVLINALIIWLTASVTGYIFIGNGLALLWATIVISIINFILHWA